MKHIKRNILIFFFFGALFYLFSLEGVLAASYQYNPMEKIPGTTESISYFPDYVKAIYKFGIWAVGIAAVLMISVGGFMYFSSAGNTSKLEKAKVVIRDSIFGIIAVLTAYLILFVINPDLVNVSLESLSRLDVSILDKSADGGAGSGGASRGRCVIPQSGNCSIASLEVFSGDCFGENINEAAGICQCESTGTVDGKGDKTDDGYPVSIGLFQINLTVHKVGGLDCPNAFDSQFTGSHHDVKIVNMDLYNQCFEAASDPKKNVEAACRISNGGTKWSDWSCSKVCGF